MHTEEYQRPDFNQMINTTVRLLDQYDIRFDSRCRILVDAANLSFISALKDRVDVDPDYGKHIH